MIFRISVGAASEFRFNTATSEYLAGWCNNEHAFLSYEEDALYISKQKGKIRLVVVHSCRQQAADGKLKCGHEAHIISFQDAIILAKKHNCNTESMYKLQKYFGHAC